MKNYKLRPSFGLLFIFLINFLLIISTHFSWNTTMNRYLPLQKEIQLVKSNLSQAHLWLEEAIEGDPYINIEKDIMIPFSNQSFYKYSKMAKDSLINDQNYLKQLKVIGEQLKVINKIAKLRLSRTQEYGIGSVLDQEFDKEFKTVVSSLDNISKDISNKINIEIENMNKFFYYIIIFLLLMNSVVFYILFINKRRQEKSENKLHDLELFSTNIIDSLENLIFVKDINSVYIACNKAYAEFLGIHREKIIGKNDYDLHDKVLADNLINHDKEILINQKSKTELVWAKDTNGEKHGLLTSKTPLFDINGNIIGLVANSVDITELKKKDKLLLQQSKMAAIGEMLGNIAHQWRQPLSVISTVSTGAKLQNELGLLKENDLNEYFDKINNTAQYLSQTIEDFRGLLNPQNSVAKEFNVSDAIDKSLSLVYAQFTVKGIEIIQNIEDFKLEAVENELAQVLINILNNAKDALIKVENQKRFIFVTTYKTDTNFVIEIKDNAKGIPEDILDRVFEPYFTTKHQSQGTGIGLYMSEEIVKNHLNGNITVSNESYSYEGIEYIGARFTIDLPID